MPHSFNPDALTPAQLAGQRLMVGFRGQVLDDELRFLIRDLHVGGLILFKRNVSEPGQVAELCRAAQAYALETGNPPLTIAIDQEGGPVARLGPPFTVFPGNRVIGNAGSEDAARDFGAVSARELKAVGITLDLAPVLDVAPPGFQSVMADRVFGEDPRLVASLGKIVIDSLQQNGVAAAAKHFPGIGRTGLDSHLDLPLVRAPRHVLDRFELPPFRAAVGTGVACIMLSHVIYEALDPDWPASLSALIAGGLLRREMGFDGVVLTDDLDMGAIERNFDAKTVFQRIVTAPIDFALICHNQEKMEQAFESLKKEFEGSARERERARASVQRILRLKKSYAL